MPFATTANGGQTYYELAGREDGEPLVLIAGMSQDHTIWEPQVPALGERYRLVLVDNRGTGQSSDFPTDGSDQFNDPPTTGVFAAHVAAVLNDAGIAKAHVLGFSMGGRIAQWLAIRHRELVGSLVLLATSPGELHGVPRSEAADEALAANSMDLVLLNYSPLFVGRNAALVARINAAQTTRGRQRQFHHSASRGHDAYSSMGRIVAPTLIVQGDADEITPPANAEILHDAIAGSEVHYVKGGRHGVAVEFAKEVNAAVLDFLGRHPLG